MVIPSKFQFRSAPGIVIKDARIKFYGVSSVSSDGSMHSSFGAIVRSYTHLLVSGRKFGTSETENGSEISIVPLDLQFLKSRSYICSHAGYSSSWNLKLPIRNYILFSDWHVSFVFCRAFLFFLFSSWFYRRYLLRYGSVICRIVLVLSKWILTIVVYVTKFEDLKTIIKNKN